MVASRVVLGGANLHQNMAGHCRRLVNGSVVKKINRAVSDRLRGAGPRSISDQSAGQCRWILSRLDRSPDAAQENVERFDGYRDAWTIWEQIHTPVDGRAYFVLQASQD